MPEPQIPNRDNPFEKVSQQLSDYIHKLDSKDKNRDANLERLMKQMMVYFKLMEKSFNKDTLTSKKGKEATLNNDKGFLKLIELMTDIDEDMRKVIDKYIGGSRLVSSEKVELARFTDSLQKAFKDSNEQIGISLIDLVNNFKTMLSNEKLSEDFRMDLIKFLREYSEEDIALTDELKKLLTEVVKSNKITEDNLTKINFELDKTIQDYEKVGKSSTFAPYLKLNKELKDANIALDDIVDLLSQSQRQKGDGKGGFGQKVKENIYNAVTDNIGDVINYAARVGAVSMSENKYLRPVAQYLPMAGMAAGGLATTYMQTRGLAGVGSDMSKLGKGALGAGKSALSKGLGYGVSAGAGIYGLGHGFMSGSKEGGLAQGFREAGAEDLSNVANVLTLGLGKKYINKQNILKGGKVGEDVLTKGLQPLSDVAGYFLSAKPRQDTEDLMNFIGDQNKRIFGAGLNLGQLLTSIFSFMFPSGGNVTRGIPLSKEEQQAVSRTGVDASTYSSMTPAQKKQLLNMTPEQIQQAQYGAMSPEDKMILSHSKYGKTAGSFGTYQPGLGNWSKVRGITSQKQPIVPFKAYSNLNRNIVSSQFQTDRPEGQVDFVKALSLAQAEITKTKGKNAYFTLTGGHGGKHASTQHKVGTAADLGGTVGVSKGEVIQTLAKYGIIRPNAQGDPGHFEYLGMNKNSVKSQPQTLASVPKSQARTDTVAQTPKSDSGKHDKIATAQQSHSSERKLKSDSDLLNIRNIYNLLG